MWESLPPVAGRPKDLASLHAKKVDNLKKSVPELKTSMASKASLLMLLQPLIPRIDA
jgi:hypothetical protein